VEILAYSELRAKMGEAGRHRAGANHGLSGDAWVRALLEGATKWAPGLADYLVPSPGWGAKITL
jgi:hypothetical protein